MREDRFTNNTNLLGSKPSYVKEEKQNPNNSVYNVELKQYFKPINSVLSKQTKRFHHFSQVRCVWYNATSGGGLFTRVIVKGLKFPFSFSFLFFLGGGHVKKKKNKCTKPIYHLGIFSIHYSLTKLSGQGKIPGMCVRAEREREGERDREKERERPVISQCQPIKHISSISAWAIHSRHSSTLLTASALHYRIEQNLKKFENLIDKS